MHNEHNNPALIDRHGMRWEWSDLWHGYRSTGSGLPAHGIDTLRTERGPLTEADAA